MADRILNHLCDYALKLSYRDLPQEVIRRTKHIVMDTVGCALGGAESPPAKIARAAASEITSASPSTVLISGQKTSPDLAAFANGVMIRYLDFNDTYAGSPTCHPSDLLAPVLAVVDARNGSGKDVILGTVLAYEVLCGLIDTGSKERGWDQATYGVIAAAVAAAKQVGLAKARSRQFSTCDPKSPLSTTSKRFACRLFPPGTRLWAREKRIGGRKPGRAPIIACPS